MDIFVLMKQTFDTEEKISVENGAIVEEGMKFIINPYDEYAIEEAIQLRDAHGGRVTVVSIGPERCAEALRTALAMGADEAVLICDPRIRADEAQLAHIAAAYLRSQPSIDVVLGGHFSIDSGGGQVAIRVAELLGLPHVGAVTRLEADSAAQAVVRRDAEGDAETVEIALPALFTAQQGLNEPRYPSLPGIMKARKKPFRQLSLDELPAGAQEAAARTERVGLTLPPVRQAGRILKGSLAEQASELAAALRHEAKII